MTMRKDEKVTEYIAHLREDGTVQTVKEHCSGTAALAEKFAASFGADGLGEIAGLLHDIGKYSPEFQRRIRDPEHTAKVDHSTAGAKEAMAEALPEIAFAVAGHHAGLPDGGSRLDGAEARTLCGRMKKQIPDCTAWRQEIHLPPAPAFSRSRNLFSQAFFTRMLYSCLVDADYLDTESFMQPEATPRGGYSDIPVLLKRLHSQTDKWLSAKPVTALNSKRNAILQNCLTHGQNWPRGLYTLTVPTGGGKTTASLAFALEHAAMQKLDRVIYVIPYTSIIDQTVAVFGGILGEENVLAHHAGADYQLKERGGLSAQQYRCALSAENWDAPVIVTTAVQFFESLYGNKSSRCRKLHNIANSIVIFDEAQTLPIPYLRPCVAAIAELVKNFRTSAVLCTATQPALGEMFAEFGISNPIQEICPGGTELYEAFRRTKVVEGGEYAEQDLAAVLSGCRQVLCVVNRRSAAQTIYESLPEDGRYCLTTLLCARDRRARLEEIRTRLKTGEPCRVVSTSLIEAGVDVDFPVAYRERTGLDSILQTAGRCNREGEPGVTQGVVTVFTLQDCPVPAMLSQNVAALQAVQRLCARVDTPEAIEKYFTLLLGMKGNPALDRKQILTAFEKDYSGRQFPFASVAEDFCIIDSPTRDIYMPIGEGTQLCERLRRGERNRALFRALGPYSVSVYPKHFDALLCANAVELIDEETVVLKDTTRYNGDTGLDLDVESAQGWFA